MELELFSSSHFGNRCALNQDVAIGRRLESGNRIEERRLATAGRAIDDDVLLWIDSEVRFFECARLVTFSLVVDDAQLINDDNGIAHVFVSDLLLA